MIGILIPLFWWLWKFLLPCSLRVLVRVENHLKRLSSLLSWFRVNSLHHNLLEVKNGLSPLIQMVHDLPRPLQVQQDHYNRLFYRNNRFGQQLLQPAYLRITHTPHIQPHHLIKILIVIQIGKSKVRVVIVQPISLLFIVHNRGLIADLCRCFGQSPQELSLARSFMPWMSECRSYPKLSNLPQGR